jgi:hypothetical protein
MNWIVALANGAKNCGYGGKPGIRGMCYLRGTRILTPGGEVRIEEMRPGDLVVTRFSGIQPIKWIGRQSFDTRFTEGVERPVRIHAGALGQNMPLRDLHVSPGHALLVGDVLVLAEYLVNGLTVTQDFAPPRIDYFNIELITHDCVIAEGVFAETYADAEGLRARFHNAAEYAVLYPDDAPPEDAALCAPRAVRGAKLAAAIGPVAARAGAGLRPGPMRGYLDAIALPFKIAGWAQDETYPVLPVLLDILLDDQVLGRVLACDYRGDLAEAGIGHGRAAFTFTAPFRLQPEQAERLHVRRAADGAALEPAATLPPPAPMLRVVA